MGALRFLTLLSALLRPSAARTRSTALELAILTGHVLLYPTGLRQERRARPPHALPATPAPPSGPTDTPELAEKPAKDGGHTPVLLLHGFIDNRSVFVLLRRSLRRHGWQHVESLNYSPLTCDVRTAAQLLARHVEDLCTRTGSSGVDVVGHSLGGLIARYYVQRLGGDARVRTLVTLGTPHGGTRVAPPMSVHPLVRQMRPGSEVIRELAGPAPNCGTRFIGFWSDLDLLMVPVETARIDHPDLLARNVRVTGVGHLALPVHWAVAAGIRQALTAEEPAAAGEGAASVA